MKRTRLLFGIGIVLTTILAATTAVYAAAVFGPPPTKPVWTNPGYQFTIAVTQLDNPDKSVCLAYHVDGAAQTPVLCTCSGANCPGGADAIYTCTIPNNFASAANITWDISSYTANNGCTGKSILGGNGTFSTGPLAVVLSNLNAESSNPLPVAAAVVLLAAVIGLALLGRRTRRPTTGH